MESTIQAHTDYRDILRSEFETRSRSNPRYSLRAFARDLRIASPRLTDILKGRYGISRLAAIQIGQRLGFADFELEYFSTLVEAKHARGKGKRYAAQARLKELRAEITPQWKKIHVDAFRAISDWYHFAILELTYIPDIKLNPKSVAAELGINPLIAEEAIHRLVRLNLLHLRDGRLMANEDLTEIPGGQPSTAIRKFHSQVLEKALLALNEQSVEQREYSSTFIAVRQSSIPKAKLAIRAFQNQFCKSFGVSQGKQKDSVYCLGVQFFEITKKGKNNA